MKSGDEVCRICKVKFMSRSLPSFADVYTFSQLFKKEIGSSPKKYMNLL